MIATSPLCPACGTKLEMMTRKQTGNLAGALSVS